MKSRLQMTARNAIWGYVSMFVSFGLSFISRTVFIYTLGEGYLGVNGLFTNVLGVLNFAELGIGSAFGFSLYKPVANNDVEKIKSLMHYYKLAYRVIAIIVGTIGLAILPLLKYIVKDPGNVGNIYVYYLIFLFNTVSSYFVSYKFSLVNAEQKNYVFTNINLLVNLSTTILQIIALLLYRNFLIYLLVAAIFGLFQKIFISIYFNKLYPYLKEKDPQPLNKEEKQTLITKVKALLLHKIGEVSVYQTDNIIISSFISTKMVGLISNYTLMTSTACNFINTLFGAVTGSLGNMMALETKEHQYSVFKKYRFIGFWFYGFSAIAIAILSKPFITLWIGDEMVVDTFVVILIVIDLYMAGQRVCFSNMKSAGGFFEPDKFIGIVQAVVNIIASIALVKLVGLPGVYIGTVLQGAIASIAKPILSYRVMFDKSSRLYFLDSIKYGSVVIIAYLLCYGFSEYVLPAISISTFIVKIIFVAIVPNFLFFIIFRKTEEFKYFFEIVKRTVFKIVKKKQ